MTDKTTHRCAVYTRKSTEEGLDQDFNSLDAQREACEAYIASQAGLGWKLIRTRYDDGGVSGGTMDRPALQQLLDDIKAAKIDVVVVYKIASMCIPSTSASPSTSGSCPACLVFLRRGRLETRQRLPSA